MGFFSSIGKIVKGVSSAVDLVGGFGARKGVSDQNEANISNAREAAAFNAQQAQMNRDFQRQSQSTAMAFNRGESQRNRAFQRSMSNTAHRRQVYDLRRAGLNPILSAKYGGSSTPSGSSGSVGISSGSAASRPAAFSQNEMQPLLEYRLNSAKTRAEIARLDAQVGLNREQTMTEKARQENLRAGAGLSGAQTRTQQHLQDKIDHEIQQLVQQRDLTQEQRRKVENEADILQHKINEAIAEGKLYSGQAGEVLKAMEKLGKAGWSGTLAGALRSVLSKAAAAAIWGTNN